MEKEVESVLKLINDSQKSEYDEIKKLNWLYQQLNEDKNHLNNECDSNNCEENEEEEEDEDADESKNKYDLNYFYVKSPSKSRKYYSCSDKSRVIYKGSDEYVENDYIKYVQKKNKIKPKENNLKNITVREITTSTSKIRNIEITHHISGAFSDDDNDEEEKICHAKIKNMNSLTDSKKQSINKIREVYKQKYIVKKETQKGYKVINNEKQVKKKIEDTEPKIDKSVGIDELLKIIEESDTKKNKKKNKNKKNEKEIEKIEKKNPDSQQTIIEKIHPIPNKVKNDKILNEMKSKEKNLLKNSNENSIEKVSNDDLISIENFRKNISIQSIHRCLVYKQNPMYKEDWISSINSLN